MQRRKSWGIALLFASLSLHAQTQTPADLATLRGLAPVTVLPNTRAGIAALGANLRITGGIQNGNLQQPTLLPFPEQEQQALRDAFTTESNLADLADGLGTTLGAAYLARAHYIDKKQSTQLSPAVAAVIAYAHATSSAHSGAGKYFFANLTNEDKKPVSPEVADILKKIGGVPDVFGKAYNLPAGAPGADKYGNSRPFQTEPNQLKFSGPDYLNVPSDNYVYNHGPAMNLTDSPSYPSGHTTFGYTGAVLLAILIPERAPQMVARGAEYGNDRILVGSHYVMDVMGGRTLALYDMAHLLANDPAYMNRTFKSAAPVSDFRAAVKAARADIVTALEAACGKPIAVCAREDTGRYNNPAAIDAFYNATQTYDLPVVYPDIAAAPEDIAKLAPEAGYLLTVAFPSLTLDQADNILTETEGPGGGFLDNGSSFGVYSRINLYAAYLKAAQPATPVAK